MALPTLRIIGFIIGIFLITLAIFMVVPMATLVIFDRTSDLPSFLWASMITFVAGLALVIPGRPEHIHLRPRDMYLLTVSSWLVVCIFAALPFLLTQHISYTDSFFESMSGITATGSTVLTGLDTMSPGILIWRSHRSAKQHFALFCGRCRFEQSWNGNTVEQNVESLHRPPPEKNVKLF